MEKMKRKKQGHDKKDQKVDEKKKGKDVFKVTNKEEKK